MKFLIHLCAKWSPAFFLIILTLVSSAFAQTRNIPPQIPNTPAGGILDRWIRVYRSGDFETIRQFMLASYAKNVLDQAAADARASNLVASFRVNGGPRIFQIEKSTDDELVAVLQTELTELWSRWTVKVSSDPPHIVTAITNVPIPPPPGSPERSLATRNWRIGWTVIFRGSRPRMSFLVACLSQKMDALSFRRHTVGPVSRSEFQIE